MTTMDRSGLAGDQKFKDVFEAFGYSIPFGKDGRRIWPTKFKREMVKRMRAGTLTVQDFRKGMDGLAAIVMNEFDLDPLSRTIFIFRAKRSD